MYIVIVLDTALAQNVMSAAALLDGCPVVEAEVMQQIRRGMSYCSASGSSIYSNGEHKL